MARIAANQKNPPELRGRMYAELAQYVYPKRRAVENTGRDGEPIAIKVEYEDMRSVTMSGYENGTGGYPSGVRRVLPDAAREGA